MSLFFISDVHVKIENDDAYKLLLKFLSLDEIKGGDKVFLVGDIFDLMIGCHVEYFTDFPDYFKKLEELIKKGVEIHYFEGNHDFHLELLYKEFVKKRSLNEDLLKVHTSPLLIEYNNKKTHISHGDDIEINNPSYKAYKKCVNNPLMKFVGNYLLSYNLLNAIGKKASKESRKRNVKRYSGDSSSYVRDKFRLSAQKVILKEHYDFVVCGHSHVHDDFLFDKSRYLNCGFSPVEKKYLVINKDGYRFNNL